MYEPILYIYFSIFFYMDILLRRSGDRVVDSLFMALSKG